MEVVGRQVLDDTAHFLIFEKTSIVSFTQFQEDFSFIFSFIFLDYGSYV